MSDKFAVRPFGQDCMGNITGYVVERYVWTPQPWSARKDGLVLEREIAGQFIGNIYERGSFEKARASADALCAERNAA